MEVKMKRNPTLIVLLVLALLVTSCGPSPVQAASYNPPEGLTESDILRLFPPQDNLMNIVDWNQIWNPPVGMAPSQGELMEAYYDWAIENGLKLDPKASISSIQGQELTLVPAVNSEGEMIAVGSLGISAVTYSTVGYTVGGASIAPAIVYAGVVVVGVVVIAGVVYFVYAYAKSAHTDTSHDPNTAIGQTRIRTIMSNPKDPNNRCFRMLMNYTKGGKPIYRYGIAQKITGANHGNSWLLAISEGNKWITVYPVTGDLTTTSALTKFVEVVACSLVTFPPVP